jgi:transcription antitermination protein NusB
VSARGKARKRALDVIFEADAKAVPVQQVLAEHQRRRESESEPSLNDYTIFLVDGVVQHQSEIDALITAHATGWDLARMPGVDRAILRIAVFEVTHSTDVPNAVAITSQCPGWDLNPHWTVFETASSAGWDTGAQA